MATESLVCAPLLANDARLFPCLRLPSVHPLWRAVGLCLLPVF